MRKFMLAVLLAFLPAATALAQQTDRYTKHSGLRDRFRLSGGVAFLKHDTVDQLTAREYDVGAVIDWEDVFGLEAKTTQLLGSAHLRLLPRHRLRVSWYRTERSGSKQLSDLARQYGAITIPVDVRIDTFWRTDTYRGDYRFSVVYTPRVDIGLSVGAYWIEAQAQVDVDEFKLGAGAQQSVPLPLAGIDFEWSFARHFMLQGGFHYLAVKLGDRTMVDGDWLEFRGALEWHPMKNFGIGVGYLQNDINLQLEFASGVLSEWNIDYETGGLNLYGFLSF